MLKKLEHNLPAAIRGMGMRERLAWAGLAVALATLLIGLSVRTNNDRSDFILRLTLLENNQARLITISEVQTSIHSQIVLLKERQDVVMRRLDVLEEYQRAQFVGGK